MCSSYQENVKVESLEMTFAEEGYLIKTKGLDLEKTGIEVVFFYLH